MQEPLLRGSSDERDAIEIFISFDEKSKNDRKLIDELQKRLHRLEEDKHVKIWSRDKIAGGQVIAEEINAHLKKAQIILLLISSDFFVSSDCKDQMMQALIRYNSRKARVIPVLLRSASWSEEPLLCSLSSHILPPNRKPITAQKREDAFLDVERGIRKELEELIERKQSVAPFYTVVEMPPSIPITPPVIQQREEKVQEVIARLTQPEVNAVVLTGMAGVGKSTLAALIRKYAENRAFSAKPLWFEISTNSSQVEIAKILYHHLNVPPPDFDNLEPSVLARLLFYALKTADESRLIVMDQFEKLLDMRTGEVRTECHDMVEWLEALNSQESACKFLLTSRHQSLQISHRENRIHTIIDQGLAVFEGKELLREFLTEQGINATEAELSIAVKRCGGNAHALELLASLLKKDRSLTLTALFADQSLWVGEVVNNLLGYIYNEQLSETQRRLLIAFSVYRNAVLLEAAQIQMSTPIDARAIGKAREALVAQHLLRFVGQGRYQLHTLVADYGYQQIDVPATMAIKQLMHEKAAQYYIQEQERSYPPPGKRREINDVQPLIEAVWHLHQSEQPRAVFELIRKESLFKDLKHWGNYTVLLDLYAGLLPVSKWSPQIWEEALISYHLGQVYDKLFQKEQAEKHFMRALLLYRKIKDHKKELEVLKYLAGIYQTRGDEQKASVCYEQALRLSKVLEDTRGEAMLFTKLAEMQNTFGKTDDALQYYNQALQIGGKTNDRKQHAATRYLMGDMYHGQGKEQEAQQHYEHALQIYRQEGDKGGEVRTLNRLGETYLAQCNIFEAQKNFNKALQTSEEIMDREIKAQVLNNLAETSIAQGRQIEARQYSELALHLFREMGDRAGEGMALYNFGRSYIEAKDTFEKEKYCRSALKIFQDTADHKREGWVFNFLGVISYEQGKTEDALRYYATALEILKDVDDRKGQGWVLNNLGNISFARNNLSEALTYFKQALEINQTVADCGGEGQKLYNIGKLYSNLRPHVAFACFLLAREIFKNGMHLRYEEVEKSITALRKSVDDEKFKAWQTMTPEQARRLVEKFLDKGL